MCKIAKELKLSLYEKAEKQATDTWTYYRLGKGKNKFYDGDVLWMEELKPEIMQQHKRTICRMLNKSSCFNFEVTPWEGDILQIVFNRNEHYLVFHYFLFSNNKWKTVYTSSKEVGYKRDVLVFGKVTNGLTSPIKASDFINND